MPYGNRGHVNSVTNIAAAVIIGLIAAGFIWAMSAKYTENRLKAEATAEEEAKATQDYINRTCVGLELGAMQACIAEAIQTSEESRRAEEDLSAQKDMAEWAFWMMMVSALTVAITALGVWFVRLTLHETQKTTRAALDTLEEGKRTTAAAEEANRIAKDAYTTDQRPWLKLAVQINPKGIVCVEGQRLYVPLLIDMSNIGKTPATNVRLFTAWRRLPDAIENILWSNNGLTYDIPVDNLFGPGGAVLPTDTRPFDWPVHFGDWGDANRLDKMLSVLVTYSGPSGDPVYTLMTYTIEYPDPFTRFIKNAEGMIRPGDLKFELIATEVN